MGGCANCMPVVAPVAPAAPAPPNKPPAPPNIPTVAPPSKAPVNGLLPIAADVNAPKPAPRAELTLVPLFTYLTCYIANWFNNSTI
jgi:hypothetical protein